MVNVAQLVEHWIVVPTVVGSSPIVHPSLTNIILMALERTLSIIKPDAVAAGQAETICQRLSDAGLEIIAFKKDYQLTQEEAEAFYADHRGKNFFEGLIQLMISGPLYIQVLEGENAIEHYRQVMGPTDPIKAAPGTLRADFGGKALPANAVHGSDSLNSACREIDFFFKSLPIL
jgi:nucleoside-diphosphate kinase